MGPVIVAEIGSTWAGNKRLAKEAMKKAKEAGASYAKFQLFEKGSEFDQGGNVYLAPELFQEFYSFGKEIDLPVTASVFYTKALELLFESDVPFIKFAHSQRKRTDWIRATMNVGKHAVVSTNVMDLAYLPTEGKVTKLFCEPVYPKMWHTNFEGLFPDRFDGYSDHSLGHMEAVRAVQFGATWLEKHFTLPYNECLATPDGRFALKPEEFKKLCQALRP